MKESKCESSSLWLNAKKSSQLIRLYVVLIVTGLLNLLDYLSLLSFLFSIWMEWECGFLLVFFIIDRNSLVKTLLKLIN